MGSDGSGRPDSSATQAKRSSAFRTLSRCSTATPAAPGVDRVLHRRRAALRWGHNRRAQWSQSRLTFPAPLERHQGSAGGGLRAANLAHSVFGGQCRVVPGGDVIVAVCRQHDLRCRVHPGGQVAVRRRRVGGGFPGNALRPVTVVCATDMSSPVSSSSSWASSTANRGRCPVRP
jgi:hypothetical protein